MRERDLLFHRLDIHGSDTILQEEFLSFVTLTEHELDDVKDLLKQRMRGANGLAGQDAKTKQKNLAAVKTELDQLGKLGPSPNLTGGELGHMLRFIDTYLTPVELTRLVHQFDTTNTGEVTAKAFLSSISSDEVHGLTHRRRAARVVRAGEALRNFIVGAARSGGGRGSSRSRSQALDLKSLLSGGRAVPGGDDKDEVNSTPAWEALVKRANRRRGPQSSFLSGGNKFDDELEADDIAVAVERQLIFDDVPRLSQNEYRQLMMLIAPGDGHSRVPHAAFHEVSMRSS